MSPSTLAAPLSPAGCAMQGRGRPSIETLLATAGTIGSLAAMRAEMAAAFAAGEIAPSPKTRRRWNVALWARVIELMRLQPHEAAHIYKTTLSWPKPEALQVALAMELQRAIFTDPKLGEPWPPETQETKP